MAADFPIFNITQDMTLWQLKLHMTKGSRDAVDQFTNEFLFACNLHIGDDALDSLGTDVGNLFATIAHGSTRILRATVGPAPAKGKTKGSRSNFQDVDFVNLIGTRRPATGKACALDQCATFKRQAKYGSGGVQKLRGVYDADELQTSDSLRYETVAGFDATPLTDFGANLQSTFERYNCGMVLPATLIEAVEGQLRPLKAYAYIGVSQKQVRNHRRSLPQEEQALFKRELKHLEREAEDVLQGLGGADIAKAAKNMVSLIGPFVAQYGSARVLAALAGGGEGASVLGEGIGLLALA